MSDLLERFHAKRQFRLGRGQAGISNVEGAGQKSNKQRLTVAAEAARNLIEGTKRLNRARAGQTTDSNNE